MATNENEHSSFLYFNVFIGTFFNMDLGISFGCGLLNPTKEARYGYAPLSRTTNR